MSKRKKRLYRVEWNNVGLQKPDGRDPLRNRVIWADVVDVMATSRKDALAQAWARGSEVVNQQRRTVKPKVMTYDHWNQHYGWAADMRKLLKMARDAKRKESK
mgnify:CR=1 FL=1